MLCRRHFFLLLLLWLTACATQPEQVYTAESYYERGVNLMQQGNYESAIIEFQQIEFLYPLSNYIQPAKLQAISAHYGLGQYLEAEALATDFLSFYPASYHKDFVHYMLGRSQYANGSPLLDRFSERDLSNSKKAYDTFQLLVKEYPKSDYAVEALAHMRHIRNLLADDALAAARFYYSRKAYIAAVNRCLYIMQNYSQAPAVKSAMELLIDAYRQLELDNLADLVQKLFDERFAFGIEPDASNALTLSDPE